MARKLALLAYPIQWPGGWPRTEGVRRPGTFGKVVMPIPGQTYGGKRGLTLLDAVARVRTEVERFGAIPESIVISTNVPVRKEDGMPFSNYGVLQDPGAAVYFRDAFGEAQCIAVDIYQEVPDNVAAVAATIEAMRAIERHGGAQVLARAFSGFKALPAAPTVVTPGEAVALMVRLLDLKPAEAQALLRDRRAARDAVRRAMARTHPDAGGSTSEFQLVRDAARIFERELA